MDEPVKTNVRTGEPTAEYIVKAKTDERCQTKERNINKSTINRDPKNS